MDNSSMIKDKASDLDRRIAERVLDLRTSNGLSLAALAQKCGVSRSMISLIERGESSPTATVLEKLATGLGVTLPSLFEAPNASPVASSPLVRREEQQQWRDPASGYVRRSVSPPGVPQPMQIVEVQFPAGQRVTFENGPRDQVVYQQVWVLEGSIDITLGTERFKLKEGDCLAMQLDRPTLFHNATKKSARYAVVIASEGSTVR
jgi:transcriptional regulator with XRE-family HTH domain